MKNQIIKGLLNGAIVVTLLAAVTQTASALPTVPDAASTASLMGLACAGLVAIRRIVR